MVTFERRSFLFVAIGATRAPPSHRAGVGRLPSDMTDSADVLTACSGCSTARRQGRAVVVLFGRIYACCPALAAALFRRNRDRRVIFRKTVRRHRGHDGCSSTGGQRTAFDLDNPVSGRTNTVSTIGGRKGRRSLVFHARRAAGTRAGGRVEAGRPARQLGLPRRRGVGVA